jgi:hypothetical protein
MADDRRTFYLSRRAFDDRERRDGDAERHVSDAVQHRLRGGQHAHLPALRSGKWLDAFKLYISAADPTGNVGTLAERPFDALVVGTGDVQVTVSWDADSDVDLHVVEPGGREIYWDDRRSPSGGELDLDSNAACIIDGVRNENITWGVGSAPQGTYTVRVDYWSSCNLSETNYTVLINNGGEIAIYRGTFRGLGDNGGLGSGVEIDSFTRTTGPSPAPMQNHPAPYLPVGPTTK